MIDILKESLWKQFGASIDMLKNAIVLWPEERWHTDKKFFYNAYHCLIFLDYYLTIPPTNLSFPLPYTIMEPEHTPKDAVGDLVPNRIYSKKELLDYLDASRKRCHTLIGSLTEEKLNDRFIEEGPDPMNYSVIEILLYNMRHVQHHTAQLNLISRQTINNASGWVSRAKDKVQNS